jgi:hypothetical protein
MSSHITSTRPAFAQEAAWCEDLRRVSNGERVYSVVGLAEFQIGDPYSLGM